MEPFEQSSLVQIGFRELHVQKFNHMNPGLVAVQ